VCSIEHQMSVSESHILALRVKVYNGENLEFISVVIRVEFHKNKISDN